MKNLEEFIAKMDGNTTLEEIAAVCKTEEDLRLVFAKLDEMSIGQSQTSVSEETRERARIAFQGVPKSEITTKAVQIKLSVGYHTASILKDWLLGL